MKGDDLALNGAGDRRPLHIRVNPGLEVASANRRLLADDDRLRRVLFPDDQTGPLRKPLVGLIRGDAYERHHAVAGMYVVVVARLRAGELVADVAQRAEHVAHRHVRAMPDRPCLGRPRRVHGRCHSRPSA